MQPSEHMDPAQGMPPMSEISDMKMASTREIKLMRKGERRILEYPIGTENEILSHGDLLQFTLNTSDAHFIDTNRMYIKAEMAIVDNSEIQTTEHADAYHYPPHYPSARKDTAKPIRHERSLFHLAHGTHTLFDRMIVMNGSETIEDNKAYHQSNVMKAIMGHSAIPKDDICGYWNSDSLVADCDSIYNVKGRLTGGGYHPDILPTNKDIQYVPVIIPVANVLENQPYLALHNFASTLELKMYIANPNHIITPLIDEERLEAWSSGVDHAPNQTRMEAGAFLAFNFTKVDVRIQLKKVRLVVEGLLLDDVTQLNTVSQSFPAIMTQHFSKNQPESTNVSQLITVQRPALKYLTVAAVKNEAYSEIIRLNTIMKISGLYSTKQLTTGAVNPVGIFHVHNFPRYSLPTICREAGFDEMSIYKFFEMPFNHVETEIGGTSYPKNFDKQANLPRGRYMELAKEFQDYSTGGSAALPAYPYSRPRPRAHMGLYYKYTESIVSMPIVLDACTLSTHTTETTEPGAAGFKAPILDNICTYHNDKFTTRDRYPPNFMPTHPERWWTNLSEAGAEPVNAEVEVRAGKSILFFNYSRLIGEDASVIGGINTNTSQMTLSGELGVPWSSQFRMVIFAFYQVVLQLNGEVGSIDQFN